jgi:hypothetical protein
VEEGLEREEEDIEEDFLFLLEGGVECELLGEVSLLVVEKGIAREEGVDREADWDWVKSSIVADSDSCESLK